LLKAYKAKVPQAVKVYQDLRSAKFVELTGKKGSLMKEESFKQLVLQDGINFVDRMKGIAASISQKFFEENVDKFKELSEIHKKQMQSLHL